MSNKYIYDKDDEEINKDDMVSAEEVRYHNSRIHVLEVDPALPIKLPVFSLDELDIILLR
jgi:hypothetical protein